MTPDQNPAATPSVPPGAALLREIIGQSPAERMKGAIEEIERQIALEDIVVVLIDTTREAARTFFDLVLQFHPQTPGNPSDDPGEGVGT